MIMLDKIYCTEEQIERANKALRLNGGSDYDYDPRLLAASSSNRKPTLRIKLLSFSGPGIKLKGVSSSNSNLQRQLLERQKLIEIERINRTRKNKRRKSFTIE